MIFAARHPEWVDGIGVMGAATELVDYTQWLAKQKNPPVLAQICEAIQTAFQCKEDMERNSVFCHPENLKNFPIVYYHGGNDEIIPVAQARGFAEKMKDSRNFLYQEIPGGNHDSPLAFYREILQKLLDMLQGGWENAQGEAESNQPKNT